MLKLNWTEFQGYCSQLALNISFAAKEFDSLYPVPKNGYPVAIELSKYLNLPIVLNPQEITQNTLIVDDLIDSGQTLSKYLYNSKAVLFVKNGKGTEVDFGVTALTQWIQFPWEQDDDIEKHITRIIEHIGENPCREGLIDTPRRVAKMYKEIFRGYDASQRPKDAVFSNGADGIVYDQMILDQGTFYSHCEHHMVPFFGKYYFAYIPSPTGKIIGLSKVARIVDFHAAKLQIQERLVNDIVEDLWLTLSANSVPPLGMALMMKAEHLCKTMRGVKKQGEMTAIKLKGCFQEQVVKNEFLTMIK